MVRLGKVYGNRMVDVAVTNSKLEDRALRMLQDLGGIPRPQGRQWLQRSGGSVKVALLMAASGLSFERAQALLHRCQGQLRRALAEAPQPPNGPQ
jgi:N-acetylmuramic acid 6-phosphate etherase